MVGCSFCNREIAPSKIVVAADMEDEDSPRICEDCVEICRGAIAAQRRKERSEVYTNVYKEITG